MLDGIRWVLFDAVGTLLYPDPPVAEAYCAVARRFGSRLSVAAIQPRFGAALTAHNHSAHATSESSERARWRKIVRAVIDDAPASSEAIFTHLWQHFAQPKHWRLYDDVSATLKALAQHGLRLGIASNFDRRLLEIIRGHAALAACEAVFVSSEIGYCKPNPKFFSAIEDRLMGVPPAAIALVGDDEVNDVQGARAAGWRAIRLDRGGQSQSSCTIQSLAELH